MRLHFIAIGGSVMHQLALALQETGNIITGSDDEIYEPSFSKLQSQGLLPEQIGWFPEKITTALDAVILGMHARKDNPELLKAQSLGIKIYSYPEYLYEHSVHKERVVIAGSHGKTTITSMVLFVLKQCGLPFDYVVGASSEGFAQNVKLSIDAPIIVIEGDEYFASPIDRTPKFLHYRHHIGLVSGISWDHINVYPDFDEYVRQFEKFAVQTPKAGALIYCEEDYLGTLACTSNNMREDVVGIAYGTHPYTIINGITYLIAPLGELPIKVFGQHNMQNISGAKAICSRLGVTESQFYEAIQNFKGASKRLELLATIGSTCVFRDFAHAPSKMLATTTALKEQFPQQQLVVCAELHTFSSLNKYFLRQYANTLDKADVAAIYFDPKTIAHKKLDPITVEDIKKGFGREDLVVCMTKDEVKSYLVERNWKNSNLLLMSSGTFGGLELEELKNLI